MKALFRQKGANLDISILESNNAQQFINAHADILDSSFQHVPMSDIMRQRLQRSNYIFSGMKAFHELNEAFPSLLDENGNRKSFEQFFNDVLKIDSTYNRNYLRSEYNFVQASASMAAKWESFQDAGDRYNLQYRTMNDSKVRPEHASMHGITLPMSDSFWNDFYPPNGWNCRCTVVQVRKSKYPVTPHDEAIALGQAATQDDTKGIFHFNPGKEQKAVPDYNPYTISACRSCPLAKGKSKLAKVIIPDNELCAACQLLRNLEKDPEDNNYYIIPTKHGKVRMHIGHGKNEREENIQVASYFADKYGYEIDLLDNPQNVKSADSFNRTLNIEQEYKSTGVATTSAIDRLIRTAKYQADHIVICCNPDASLGALTNGIKDRVNRCDSIKSITLLIDGKDAVYSREDIVKGNWEIKQADFK